jgi:hypothetical protein
VQTANTFEIKKGILSDWGLKTLKTNSINVNRLKVRGLKKVSHKNIGLCHVTRCHDIQDYDLNNRHHENMKCCMRVKLHAIQSLNNPCSMLIRSNLVVLMKNLFWNFWLTLYTHVSNTKGTWYCLVGTVTMLQAGWVRVRIPARTKDSSILQIVQTGSGPHPVSDSVSTEGSFLGCKASGAWWRPLTII